MGPLPFVGRRRVLAGIAAAADRARTGWGGLLALTGPAGVGKTRTAQEAAARADGFRVLWAWCPSGADGSPFRPWARLLADLAADDPACARAVRASPPLRALLAGRAAGLLPASDPEGARLRLTGDTVQLVRTAAARRPLLLVLDDVHAADPSSLRLLLELAAAARTAPLLLLVTARDGDPDWPGRDDDRAELLRRADGLPLGPLGEPDVARLLAAATGADPGPADVRLAVERTGRDAFLLTELIGSEDGLHGPPPAGVRAAVAARTAHLAPEGRRALAAAAVLGSPFRLDLLAETLACGPGELPGHLAGARDAGLLADDPEPGTGAFRHDLLREAVHDAVLAAAPADLHRRAAAALAARARPGDGGPAGIARHLLLAGPEHRTGAAEQARLAGDGAAALLAYEDAVRWYTAAADADPDAPPDGLAELHLALAAARFGTGEPAAARTACLRAAGFARAAGRADLLARAALGLGTGPVGFEIGLLDRAQLDLLAEARGLLGDGRPGLRAAVTARLSVAAALVEPEERRIALAEEAVRLARTAAAPAALGSALAALCDARSGPDHCRHRSAWADEIVGLARALPDPALELLGRRLRLVALLETGDHAGADAEVLAFDALADALRRPLYAWYVPLWRGARALLEGRYEDCGRHLAEAEEAGRRAGSENAAILTTTQRWCMLAATGDRAGLAALAAGGGLEEMPGVWPRVTLALLAAQCGRADDAARRLTAVAPRLAGAPRDSEWLPMLAQAAETVGLLGGHPAARELYRLLAPYAGLWAVEGIGAAVRGPVEHHLALLAAATDDPAAAARHTGAALAALAGAEVLPPGTPPVPAAPAAGAAGA
ncbi:AAA family ATPase, partial [Kitasatospora paranensis]